MGEEINELRSHIKKQLSKGYRPDDIKKALRNVGFSSSSVNEAFAPYEPKRVPLMHRIFKPKKKEEKQKITEKKPAAAKKSLEKKHAMQKQAKARAPAAEEKKPNLFTIFRKEPGLTEMPVREERPALPSPEPEHILLPPPPEHRFAASHHKRLIIFLIVLFGIILATAAILFLIAPICMTEKCFINAANECSHATFRNTIKGTGVHYEVQDCLLVKTVTALGPEEPQEIVDAFLGQSMTCRYQMKNFNPLYLSTITGLINTCDGPLKDAILRYIV